MTDGLHSCCRSNQKKADRIKLLSEILGIVSVENRLKILCILEDKDHCVCEIMETTDMSQSLISHHIADLKEANLVTGVKKGRRVNYRLTKLGKKVMALLGEINIKKFTREK